MQTLPIDDVELDRYFSNIRFERRASETEFVLVSPVSRSKVAGLPTDLAAGTIVLSDGLDGDGSRVCKLSRGDGEVFALQAEVLTPYVRTWEKTCYMPHDPQL